MDLGSHTLVWLPLGLGLLGFVEPCSIGGHLVFLDTQANRSSIQRVTAALMFTVARSLVTGLFGAVIAFVGQSLISLQAAAWLVFGLIYLALGLSFLINRASMFKRKIELALPAWQRTHNPMVLGFVLGLNIPACAAPILFGLLALAATTGTALAGFLMMFLFGLALSAPLVALSISPRLGDGLRRIGDWMKRWFWLTGIVFNGLGRRRTWSHDVSLFPDGSNPAIAAPPRTWLSCAGRRRSHSIH